MTRQHRRGLSLTEVLVAMFVMALGLMALLTLFPLGAMQIGQALKDDRTAQTASQADAWVRVWWKDAVAVYDGPPRNSSAVPFREPMLAALDDPNVLTVSSSGGQTVYTATASSILPQGSTLNTQTSAPNNLGFVAPADTSLLSGTRVINNSGVSSVVTPGVRPETTSPPSYPVFLDPLGFTARGVIVRPWVGKDTQSTGLVYGSVAANPPLLIPRRNAAVIGDRTQAYATCALTDDLTFQANGGAGNGTEPLGRQGRYHWAAMIQRSDNGRPETADLTVLVFDGRPPFLGIQGDEVVLTNEFVNPLGPSALGTVTAGDRSISLNVPTRGADQPQLVRRGGWVMIACLQTGVNGVRSVGFHRVTGLTTGDESTVSGTAVTQVSVDIDPPVKAELKSATGGTLPVGQVQVYLLAGLSEVFNRPPLLP